MLAAMQPTEGPGGGAAQPAPSISEVAAAFPQLEVIEMIGQGGMGCVFKARQPRLNRLVALKLLPASLAQRDAAFAGRFEREGQLLARLHHPNIVAVHDSGTAGEFFYLIMEYVDGVNLRQAMRAQQFTAPQALAIVPLICDALQYAHDEGVLHRDIKPENILLDAKGRVKLADFGIAKMIAEADLTAAGSTPATAGLTHSSATIGTPSYMAPEQRETPGDIDHRADIYSLGVVFYELLTGELPRERFTPPSARSQADPRIDPIVQQALEKDRDRRQGSANEVRTQVTSLGQAVAPTPARKSPVSSFVAGILLLLAIVVPLIVMSRMDRSIQERSAEQLARIKEQQQQTTALSTQLADAQANAGRAASRAGNGAMPDAFREEARKEQQQFEEKSRKLQLEMSLAHARLSEQMAAGVHSPARAWLMILGSMLPFAVIGLILLARQGNTREALLALGVLLALIVGYLALRAFRDAPVRVSTEHAARSIAPGYATIKNNAASAYLAHDDVDLHYAIYYAGDFSTSSSGSQNKQSFTWLDESAIKLANGRTFGLRRDSVNDLFVTINGAEYDLRQGRLFVLRDDGTATQRGVHPALGEARSLEHLQTLAATDSPQAALEQAKKGTAMESWSYSPHYLTRERLVAWTQSPLAEKAGWSAEIAVIGKDGLITVTGPRAVARRAATLLRELDQPEVKNLLELPLLNMDPAFFTRWALPPLMVGMDFAKQPMTEALVETLNKAGVSASQLALALSAHVLELDKANFVNQGVPFESIVRSPGASTYYEATIPCADRPDRPLTFRIERTTQQMGTQSKIAEFAPWLIEEAKAISAQK